MPTNTIRIMTVAALCVAPLALGTSAAMAGGATQDRLEQPAATTWIDRGSVPGLLGGNVHRGEDVFTRS